MGDKGLDTQGTFGELCIKPQATPGARGTMGDLREVHIERVRGGEEKIEDRRKRINNAGPER